MTLRQHLETIEKLSDPLPKTADEAFDRLCLISEEIEEALAIFNYAERGSKTKAFEKWNLNREHIVISDPVASNSQPSTVWCVQRDGGIVLDMFLTKERAEEWLRAEPRPGDTRSREGLTIEEWPIHDQESWLAQAKRNG